MRAPDWKSLQPVEANAMAMAHLVVGRALDLVEGRFPIGKRRLWAGYESLMIGVVMPERPGASTRVAVLQDTSEGALHIRFRAVFHPAEEGPGDLEVVTFIPGEWIAELLMPEPQGRA